MRLVRYYTRTNHAKITKHVGIAMSNPFIFMSETILDCHSVYHLLTANI